MAEREACNSWAICRNFEEHAIGLLQVGALSLSRVSWCVDVGTGKGLIIQRHEIFDPFVLYYRSSDPHSYQCLSAKELGAATGAVWLQGK